MKAQVDEFALVLLGGLIFISILVVVWTSQASTQITVMPLSKTLVVERGSSTFFYLYLNGSAFNVLLRTSGKIADWISFDRNNFTLEGEAKVKVTVRVPSTISYGTYWGEIYVETLGFQKVIPVSVEVSKTRKEETIPFSFGDFSVGYLTGEEVITERKNVNLVKGYFSDFFYSFVAKIPEEKFPLLEEAYLQITIDQTNSLGNLVVEFNEKEVFSKKVGSGEIFVTIPKELVGKVNSIVLRTTAPGFLFWTQSFYNIASVEFVVKYNGTTFRYFEFSLESFEAKNFKEGKISFFVEPRGSQEAKLIIKINDKTVYEDIPQFYVAKRFGGEVKLLEGKNTISFSTEAGGSYHLEDVTLTISQY